MNANDTQHLEAQLRRAAQNFAYPPTPQLVHAPSLRLDRLYRQPRRVSTLRRLAVSFTLALLALLSGMLSTPQARAALAEFLQIGAVRIFQQMPPPTALPVFASPPAGAHPTPDNLAGLGDLLGETDLATARQRVHFHIRLPAYPPDLGAPERVFLQDMNGSLLILVWPNATQPQRARLSLHIIAPGSFALSKTQPQVVQETQVNGRPAVWAEGPYLLVVKNAEIAVQRLLDGHVLIWEQDGLTYRLETGLPIDEALRIAESLE